MLVGLLGLLGLLLLAGQWYGGRIPFIREPERFQVDVYPDEPVEHEEEEECNGAKQPCRDSTCLRTR
jgi:hypothetical protein